LILKAVGHCIIFYKPFISGLGGELIDMSSDVMWVEKYRPKKLSELVNQKEIVGTLTALLKNPGEMPHLMFTGSAGVGKTTAALCIS